MPLIEILVLIACPVKAIVTKKGYSKEGKIHCYGHCVYHIMPITLHAKFKFFSV